MRRRGALPRRDGRNENSRNKMNPDEYPGPCPKAVKVRLLPIAKRIAEILGEDAHRRSIVLTDDVICTTCCGLLGAVTAAAHDVLLHRESLLADPEVEAWVRMPNNQAER